MPYRIEPEVKFLDVVRPSVFALSLLTYATVGWATACASRPPPVPEPESPPGAWTSDDRRMGVLTRDLPHEPFPGQRRAKDGKCGVRQIPLRHPGGKGTGCWKRLADPPEGKEGCGEDFEWLGFCYAPVLEAKKEPAAIP
jgi:hypothetical protein